MYLGISKLGYAGVTRPMGGCGYARLIASTVVTIVGVPIHCVASNFVDSI